MTEGNVRKPNKKTSSSLVHMSRKYEFTHWGVEVRSSSHKALKSDTQLQYLKITDLNFKYPIMKSFFLNIYYLSINQNQFGADGLQL